MTQAAKKYITVDDLLERWCGAYTRGTLANLRSQRKGPPFAKFGTKILYPLDALEKWEAKNLHLVPSNDNDNDHA